MYDDLLAMIPFYWNHECVLARRAAGYISDVVSVNKGRTNQLRHISAPSELNRVWLPLPMPMIRNEGIRFRTRINEYEVVFNAGDEQSISVLDLAHSQLYLPHDILTDEFVFDQLSGSISTLLGRADTYLPAKYYKELDDVLSVFRQL